MTDEIYAKVFDQAGSALTLARKAMTMARLSAILAAAALIVAVLK